MPREDFLYSFKVGRVLDLYQGVWTGQPLGPNDYVICSDEKPSIQAQHVHLAGEPGAWTLFVPQCA